MVTDNLVQCLEIDEQLAKVAKANEDFHFANLRDAYVMLSKVRKRQGLEQEFAALDELVKSTAQEDIENLPLRLPAWAEALTDVWTWRNDIVGHKLGSSNPQARLIALHLDSEFTAVANIALAEGVEALIQEVKRENSAWLRLISRSR